MSFYFAKYNQKGINHKTLNRNTIKSIKKQFVREKPEYETLRKKFLGKGKVS
jgi:hypothetical protein